MSAVSRLSTGTNTLVGADSPPQTLAPKAQIGTVSENGIIGVGIPTKGLSAVFC